MGGDWCNFFVCRILRNFLPLLYFFLITSIFSRLSAEVVAGVLIQSNERRDNGQQQQPTSRLTPCIRSSLWRPCHWDGQSLALSCLLPAGLVGRPMLISEKEIMIFFLWSLDDELLLSHRFCARSQLKNFWLLFHGYLPLSENLW